MEQNGGVESGGILEVLDKYTDLVFQKIHTQIPAMVTDVDYDKSLVSVKPLVTTTLIDNSDYEAEYPELLQVPVYTNSANKGISFQSHPIKIGDVGTVVFSERNLETLMTSDASAVVNTTDSSCVSLGGTLFSLWFVNGYYTPLNNFKTDPDNLITKNDKSCITQKPDGECGITNEKGSYVLSADGKHTLLNDSDTIVLNNGNINIETSGSVTINGATVTSGGNVITKNGTDLDQLKADFDAHKHSQVKKGGDISGGIVV